METRANIRQVLLSAESKNEIRQKVLQIRNQMTEVERKKKSSVICNTIRNLTIYKNAEMIFTYVDFGSEVKTSELITTAIKEGKKIAVPKIIGNRMDFYQIQSMDDLHQGYFGIREPDSDVPVKNQSALMLMPGVVFDRERSRIGYGKGFYDKYLEENPMKHTVAVAYECQIQDRIPSGPLDKKPFLIVTECNIYQ